MTAAEFPPALDRELLRAFRAAFRSTVTSVDESALRTIGNSYGSVCFTYGPETHPPAIERLRAAMDMYVAARPEAAELLFPGVPF